MPHTEGSQSACKLVIVASKPPAFGGSLNESHLLPATGQRLRQLNLRPREIALDGGFTPGPVRAHLPATERLFISGHHAPHARKTNRRLAKVPRRRRRPHQPPQTTLRARPSPSERPQRRAHLGRLGDPRLQPRHARPPGRLTGARPARAQPANPHRHRTRPARLRPSPPVTVPPARDRPMNGRAAPRGRSHVTLLSGGSS